MAQAAKKPYCAKLKLNNKIKINKKKTYTAIGVLQEQTFFPKGKKIKVKYTIQSKRKSAGKKYKVTYKAQYKFLNNPKLENTNIFYDDWYWGLTFPVPFYTVFNYKTGKLWR